MNEEATIVDDLKCEYRQPAFLGCYDYLRLSDDDMRHICDEIFRLLLRSPQDTVTIPRGVFLRLFVSWKDGANDNGG